MFDLELVEPHGSALPASHEQAQGNGSEAVGKALIEQGTVRVVDHDPVVALGADGNVGEVERSQHVRIEEHETCHVSGGAPVHPGRPPLTRV